MQRTKPNLTATHFLEYLYCPRFTYFEHVLNIPEHQEKRYKVHKGRQVHETVRKINPGYLRKRLGVADVKTDVYLRSPSGIRGIVDEVLFLADGTAAPLDYKFAQYNEIVYETYKTQLVIYGRLIRDNFGQAVHKGYIVYTRSKNKLVEVPITDKDYTGLEKMIDRIEEIIVNCRYPRPTRYKRRCPDCCYANLCEKAI